MSCNSKHFVPWFVIVILGVTSMGDYSWGQTAGYQQPNFSQLGFGGAPGGGGGSPFPASPLAGGMPAAQGDAFMDASGNSIVMPASYCQGGPAGGYCPGGGPGSYGPGGYGDPMAVDFGGYGQDQCGPHYFDVAIESVFLQQSDLAGEGLPALSSFGNGFAPGETNAPYLAVGGAGDSYEPGWRIAARVDIGALAVLEATYTGLYDLGFEQSVSSSAIDAGQPNQLFSIFSNYGFIDQDGGDGIDGLPGLDEASSHHVIYESDLQSTEFSYRRYWLGHNPRVSGTYLMGFRYTRMTEDFIFSAVTLDGNGSIGTFTKNDLVGFQFGGDGWVSLRQGLRMGVNAKTGIYNNRFKFNTSITDVGATPANVQADTEGNQIAFIAEGGVSIVADLLPSWSLKGGYEWLYLNSLVTAQGNVNTAIYDDTVTAAPTVGTQGHVFYHGFHGGVEYVW